MAASSLAVAASQGLLDDLQRETVKYMYHAEVTWRLGFCYRPRLDTSVRLEW